MASYMDILSPVISLWLDILSVVIEEYLMTWYIIPCHWGVAYGFSHVYVSPLSCSSWNIPTFFSFVLLSRSCGDPSPLFQHPLGIFNIQFVHQVFFKLGFDTIWFVNDMAMYFPYCQHIYFSHKLRLYLFVSHSQTNI